MSKMINDLEYMDGFFFEPAQSIKEKVERISLGTEFFKHSLKLGRYESEKKYLVQK